MNKYTKAALLLTKKKVLLQVEEGKLGVKTAAGLLGITRQGLWKLRKNFKLHGNKALLGRKRGPKSWYRVHNRKPEWVEEKVEEIFLKFGAGPDTLLWVIKDFYHDSLGSVNLSRSTIYRILVRRRLLFKKSLSQKDLRRLKHKAKYTKTYPGEEVQLDTTEPYGKGKGILLNIIDDYSRWKASYFYQGNTSLKAAQGLSHFLTSAPFPVQQVRVDNGPEFKKDFKTFCNQKNITIIKNRPNTPEHNGKVERLHRTIQEECLYWIKDKERQDQDKVNYYLCKHTNWYNSKRRHLGYRMERKTPQQKIEDWIIKNKTLPCFSREVNETLILYSP